MYYSVCFKQKGKSYYFWSDDRLEIGSRVIASTEKGLQLGKVLSEVSEDNIKDDLKNNIKKIDRLATDEDYDKYLNNLKDAEEALIFAKKMVVKQKLNMKLLDAYYTFDRNQLIFNFVSDERVDFRELVKSIASKYKTRIELHQLGVRDKAKVVGGIGSCGRELCCTRFLNEMDTISINMAKNQNISLNPSKINGLCGRLLCCLAYENDVYSENRCSLPKIGEIVSTDKGKGKVVSIDILKRKYVVNINGEDVEFYGAE